MWSKLEEVFDEVGYTPYRQGSFSDTKEYPPSFFTFWNPSSFKSSFYDDHAHKAIWYWNVNFYTNNPSLLYSELDKFIRIAKAKGFIVDGRGNDIQSDRTDYYGRTITIIYIEDYQNTGGLEND